MKPEQFDINKEKIKILLADLNKAFSRLKESLDQPPTVFNQDSSIKRFEFTFEMAWKLMKAVCEFEGVKTASPRQSIRQIADIGIIENPEDWFEFLKSRNLTVHTYKEEIATKVYKSAKQFVPYVQKLLFSVEKYLKK